MDDAPHHSPRADWEPSPPTDGELRASLARSDADIAAGETQHSIARSYNISQTTISRLSE